MPTNEYDCHANVFDKSLFHIPVNHSPLLYPHYPAHGFSFSIKRDANEKHCHCKIIPNNCWSFHTLTLVTADLFAPSLNISVFFPTFAVSLPLINWNSFGVSQESWERHICSNQEFQLFHQFTWYQTHGPLLPWQRRERYLRIKILFKLEDKQSKIHLC